MRESRFLNDVKKCYILIIAILVIFINIPRKNISFKCNSAYVLAKSMSSTFLYL